MALVQPWRVHEYTGCGVWAQAADERRHHLRAWDTWQACLTQRSLVPWGGLGSQTVWGNDGLGKQRTSGTWKWASYTHTACPAVKTWNVLSDPSHPHSSLKQPFPFFWFPAPSLGVISQTHFSSPAAHSSGVEGTGASGKFRPTCKKPIPFKLQLNLEVELFRLSDLTVSIGLWDRPWRVLVHFSKNQFFKN